MINLIFLTLIFLFRTASASSTCPPPSKDIAEKVQQNTFKIIPRNSYAESIPVSRAREIYQGRCHIENLTISEVFNCNTLSTCEGLDCKIEHMPHGTAFLANQQSLLLTAWHVVFPSHAAPLVFLEHALSKLEQEELHQKLKVLKPDFLLLNSSDEIVFDTRKYEQPTNYTILGDPLSTIYQSTGRRRGAIYGYIENAASDFVGVQLPRTLLLSSQTLSVSPVRKKTDLDPSSCFYSAGFPYYNGQFTISSGQKEELREMQKKVTSMMDFSLKPLHETHDEILKKTIPEILSLMGYSHEQIEQTLAKYDSQTIMDSIKVMLNVQARNMRDQELENHEDIIFFDAPVLPGQSGGPILDSHGNVVGITTNAFFDRLVLVNNHYASHGSAGVFIGVLNLLP